MPRFRQGAHPSHSRDLSLNLECAQTEGVATPAEKNSRQPQALRRPDFSGYRCGHPPQQQAYARIPEKSVNASGPPGRGHAGPSVSYPQSGWLSKSSPTASHLGGVRTAIFCCCKLYKKNTTRGGIVSPLNLSFCDTRNPWISRGITLLYLVPPSLAQNYYNQSICSTCEEAGVHM